MTQPQDTTFLILAGGVGKRFAPFVTNKTLVPVMGKPLLAHTLEQIARIGGKEVVVVTNEVNQTWLQSYSHPQLSISTVLQPEASGMAAAVLAAAPLVGQKAVLIMNAIDQVDDALFTDLFAKTKQADFVIVGKEQSTYFPGGYLKLDGDRVTSIIEKPQEGKQPSNLINLVFHFFADIQPFLHHLHSQQTDRDDLYEVALDQLMKEQQVSFVPYADYWQAVKYPHMLLDVIELSLSHLPRQPQTEAERKQLGIVVSPQASIAGPVVFGSQVQVEAGAVIKGPCYIGDRSIIGTNSLVRSSCIEADCIVGFGSEVARSYVGPGVKLHHNFVGDTVLEGNCNPSWGTCFANWRFDSQAVRVFYPDQVVQTERQKLGSIVGQGAFLGVHCSVMPGSTIAANTVVYPGLTVKGHVTGTHKAV